MDKKFSLLSLALTTFAFISDYRQVGQWVTRFLHLPIIIFVNSYKSEGEREQVSLGSEQRDHNSHLVRQQDPINSIPHS
jgi:hypothetical protein